jgi:hypothetical protein
MLLGASLQKLSLEHKRKWNAQHYRSGWSEVFGISFSIQKHHSTGSFSCQKVDEATMVFGSSRIAYYQGSRPMNERIIIRPMRFLIDSGVAYLLHEVLRRVAL